jgi:hypothetical protein
MKLIFLFLAKAQKERPSLPSITKHISPWDPNKSNRANFLYEPVPDVE